MSTTLVSPRRKRRNYLVAMVIGTALSTGAPSASAAASDRISETAITDISRYCTACWRNARLPADRWQDCTQEVFRRLLDRVEPEAWGKILSREGEDRREFLRAIDAIKKRTQRDGKRTVPLVGVVADRRDAGARDRACEREAVHVAADTLLSGRQQRILQMSFEGWSVHDMARELALPAERVSDEKYKAIRKLRQHFCRAAG